MSEDGADVVWFAQFGDEAASGALEPASSLCDRPVAVETVADVEAAVALVEEREPVAVVSEGLDVEPLLVRLRGDHPELPVVAVGDPTTHAAALSDPNADVVRPGDGAVEAVQARLAALVPGRPTPKAAPEESLVRYETIMEAVGDGVYALDEGYEYIYVNDAMVDITGYERDALLGQPVTIVLSGDDLSTGVGARGQAVANPGEVQRIDLELDRAAGSTVPVENRFAAMLHEGQFLGTVGVVRDVTERRRREAELRHKTESLEAFASLVSHDLRNPLAVASGYLEDLADRVDDPAVAEIRSSHERMETIIDDLLLLARDKEDISVKSVDLGAVARDAWSAVPTGSATLTVERDGTLEAAPSHLQQLLENCFRNAVEHGGSDVAVTVTRTDDGFHVDDDGVGFPADVRDRAFEKGVSGDDGTGLGLSIVRAVADAHGWSVAAEESDDGGARVRVSDVESPVF